MQLSSCMLTIFVHVRKKSRRPSRLTFLSRVLSAGSSAAANKHKQLKAAPALRRDHVLALDRDHELDGEHSDKDRPPHFKMPRILFVSGFHPSTRARDLAYEFERYVLLHFFALFHFQRYVLGHLQVWSLDSLRCSCSSQPSREF